jgi:copper chaperone CopZ
LIHSILEPIDGVEKVMINVPIKLVTLDHDPSKVTADTIVEILNKNQFGAVLKRDGGGDAGVTTQGRSHLYVQKICCASEIPAINAIIVPLQGVTNVSINTTTKMVYVDHDVHVTSAHDICDALNAEHFGASIKKDAGEEMVSAFKTYVESILSFTPSTVKNAAAIEEFLLTVDKIKLEAFEVDATSGKIKLTHNPFFFPAKGISNIIAGRVHVSTTVFEDGGEHVFRLEDEEQLASDDVSRPSIPTIFSGIFWVISMFSLIGGNW